MLATGLVLFIASRPSRFRYERALEIPLPAARVFPLLADFREWVRWSPWEGLDPALRREYTGEPGKVGTSYAWDGKGKAGAGRMVLEAIRPDEGLEIRLEFLRPFKAVNRAVFHLVPFGQGTLVTWSMEGRNGFLSKAMGLAFNFDSLIGRDFEKGLANLSKAAQGLDGAG